MTSPHSMQHQKPWRINREILESRQCEHETMTDNCTGPVITKRKNDMHKEADERVVEIIDLNSICLGYITTPALYISAPALHATK